MRFSQANAENFFKVFSENTPKKSVYPVDNTATYTAPGGYFTSSYPGSADVQYNPSYETKKVLDYLESTKGKKIDIRQIPVDRANKGDSVVHGYYVSGAPTGGHSDPKSRVLHLHHDASTSTVAHEAAHAFDPALHEGNLQEAAKQQAAINKQDRDYQTKSERLREYMSIVPTSRLRAETVAQQKAAEYMRGAGLDPSEFVADPWYKGYPASYIDKGLDTFAAATSTPSTVGLLPSEQKQDYFETLHMSGKMPTNTEIDANTRVDFNPEFTQNLLDLALDRKYQAEEDRQRAAARNYIDRNLK